MLPKDSSRWTVIGPGKSQKYLLCRCACGTVREVSKYALDDGGSRSCGCSRRGHGWTKTRTYQIWQAMRQRVVKQPAYRDRGIRVCRRWDESFEAFLADMGECPPGLEIDRIDNDGDYEPENCRWATRAQQTRNTRQNRNLTHDGRTMCLKDWEMELGFGRGVLAYRLNSGWGEHDALTTPMQPHKNRGRA